MNIGAFRLARVAVAAVRPMFPSMKNRNPDHDPEAIPNPSPRGSSGVSGIENPSPESSTEETEPIVESDVHSVEDEAWREEPAEPLEEGD